MAIEPNTLYPTRTLAPSADYPLGAAKDESAPGADDGTPLEAVFLNDLWGFFQWLLSQGGVAPGGVPDTVQVSDYGQALGVLLTSGSFQWGAAAQVGNSLDIGAGGNDAVTALSDDTVAVIGSSIDELRTYQFDGTDWAQVGNSLAVVLTGDVAVTALSDDTVAILDSSNSVLRTYQFDGTDWAQVGNSLAVSNNVCSLTALSDDTVAAFVGQVGPVYELRTYQFDGTDWAQVGNSLGLSGGTLPSLANLYDQVVALHDATTEELRTYQFDGTDWAQVGTALTVTSTAAIAAINGSDVMAYRTVDDTLQAYRFDGTAWRVFGESATTGAVNVPVLAALGRGRVALARAPVSANIELEAYSFGVSSGGPYSPAGGAF